MNLNPFENNVLTIFTPYTAFVTKKVLARELFLLGHQKTIKEENLKAVMEFKIKNRQWKRTKENLEHEIRETENHRNALIEAITAINEGETTKENYNSVLKKIRGF